MSGLINDTGSEGMFKCPICKTKKRIGIHESIECPNCGGIMTPLPKKKYLLAVLGAIVVIGIIVICILHPWNQDNQEPLVSTVGNDTSTVTQKGGSTNDDPTQDTTKPVDPNPPVPNPDDFPYYVSYGYYSGQTKNGYAEGQGEFLFTKEHLINENDKMRKRTAKKNWYLKGTFQHGFFLYGDVYDEHGSLVDVINIGLTNNSEEKYGEPLKPRANNGK